MAFACSPFDRRSRSVREALDSLTPHFALEAGDLGPASDGSEYHCPPDSALEADSRGKATS